MRFLNLSWLFALVAFALSLASWSLASPVGASPDEDFHLVSIWCANENSDLCKIASDPNERFVSKALVNSACFAFDPKVTANCQDFSSETNQIVLTDRGNFASNYPPVYYWVLSRFATDDIPTSVVMMRLFNVVFLVGMITVTLFALPRKYRLPLSMAFLMASIPLGSFLIASVNPSSWAIVLVPLSFISLRGALISSSGPSRAFLFTIYAFCAILASGARADAAAFVIAAALLALWVESQSIRENLRRQWIILCGILFVSIFIFEMFSFTSQSQIVSTGLPGLSDPSANSARGSIFGAIRLLAFNLSQLPSLWAGSFGTWNLGWLDTPMPAGVWFFSLFAISTLLITALTRFTRKQLLIFGAWVALLAAVPIVILQLSAARVGQQVQPRYILPLVSILFMLCAWELTRFDRRASIPVIIGTVVLSIANAIALGTNLLRYVYGYASSTSPETGSSWWWGDWSPILVFGAGSIAFGIVALCLAAGIIGNVKANSQVH